MAEERAALFGYELGAVPDFLSLLRDCPVERTLSDSVTAPYSNLVEGAFDVIARIGKQPQFRFSLRAAELSVLPDERAIAAEEHPFFACLFTARLGPESPQLAAAYARAIDAMLAPDSKGSLVPWARFYEYGYYSVSLSDRGHRVPEGMIPGTDTAAEAPHWHSATRVKYTLEQHRNATPLQLVDQFADKLVTHAGPLLPVGSQLVIVPLVRASLRPVVHGDWRGTGWPAGAYFLILVPEAPEQFSEQVPLLARSLHLLASQASLASAQERAQLELEAQGRVLANYGHTISRRLDPLLVFFDTFLPSAKQIADPLAASAAQRARSLARMSVVLRCAQLHSRSDLDDALAPQILRGSKSLDLLEYIRQEGSRLRVPVRLAETSNPGPTTILRTLDPHPSITRAVLPALVEGRKRVCDEVYKALLDEILLNVVRHGLGVSSGEPTTAHAHAGHVPCPICVRTDLPIDPGLESYYHARPGLVPLWIRSTRGPTSATSPTIVFANKFIDDGTTTHAAAVNEWRPYPLGRTDSGPGMAISILWRLDLGDVFLRVLSRTEGQHAVYELAASLRGLELEE